MANVSIRYKTPASWRIAFLLFSVFPLCLSSYPLFRVLQRNRDLDGAALLFPLIFTTLFLPIGLALLFYVFRTVQYSKRDDNLFQTVSLFGWNRVTSLDADRIYLVRQWFGNRNPQAWLAIYSGKTRKKKLLANEQMCDDVDRLFRWFKSNSQMKCIDMADRKTIGG